MKKKHLIAFLDKSNPPKHSFIDGFLATLVPDVLNWETTLIVSKSNEGHIDYYKSARCLPLLDKKPSGFFRKTLSILKSYFLTIKITNDDTFNHILFVRNDPFLLLGLKLVKKINNKQFTLIYQNSFPFEETYKNKIAKYLYLKLITIFPDLVDLYLTVSPLAMKRVKSLTNNTVSSYNFIPLMADFPSAEKIKKLRITQTINFIYIGTHSKRRHLSSILEGICNALQQNTDAKFTFVGGSTDEIKELLSINQVQYWVKHKKIIFLGKVDRTSIIDLIKGYDVGISLIPNNIVYKESSPTKLVEYMSQGLATLSSYGIDLQEDIVNKSNSGILCEFQSTSISKAILELCNDIDSINIYKENSLEYAKKHLCYINYLEVFNDLT